MPDDAAPRDAALAERPPSGGLSGDALWDDWDTPPVVPPAPVVHVDGFDGPIDLLLDLAERQRIDLGRISIVALVDQFVAAFARLEAHVPIERRADWLVIATRLVLLRSRLLCPATPEAAAAAECEAAREVARIDELRFIRAAASWLQARPRLGIDVFARGRAGRDPGAASYMALMEACLTVLLACGEASAEAPVYRPPLAWVVRIPDALMRLRALVARLAEARPLAAFYPPASPPLRARSAVAATFMAALELCRRNEIGLAQAEPFGPIVVQPAAATTEGASQASAA